jgi:hypothetical protein
VISRCRIDIPPLTLLIESDVIKVVLKVNNLRFVFNERLSYVSEILVVFFYFSCHISEQTEYEQLGQSFYCGL